MTEQLLKKFTMTYKSLFYYGIKSICITYIILLDVNYYINLIIINKHYIFMSVDHNINLILKIKSIFTFIDELYKLYSYIPFILSYITK